jgi:hypothetical protein
LWAINDGITQVASLEYISLRGDEMVILKMRSNH